MSTSVVFYMISYLILFSFIWSYTEQHVFPERGPAIKAHFRGEAIYKYAKKTGIPVSHIDVFEQQKLVATKSDVTVLFSKHWLLKVRPLVGDHIHMAISFWVDGRPRAFAEHDRAVMEDEPYDTKSDICQTPGRVAYTKVWPHSGVHTHCDGLIHVHPWSAPRVLRREGIDVNLGMWFDAVGIRYHETPLRITFANGTSKVNNATHRWRILERKCFLDEEYILYESHFDKIWLGHAYASYVVWYDKLDTDPPAAISSHNRALLDVGAYSYNDRQYPQKCVLTE